MYTKETEPYNQPQSYIGRNETQQRPQEYEMRNYTEQRNQPEQQRNYTEGKDYEQQPVNNNESAKDEQPSNAGYAISWLVFIAALVVNIGMWAIDFFAVAVQASNYYTSSYTVSGAVDVGTYTSSTLVFGTTNTNDALPIAMSLIYSWVLWKFPLIVYSYHLIEKRVEGKGVKIGTFVGLIVVLLAIDIILTIFLLSIYNEYMYYGAYVLFTLIVAIINNSGLGRTKQAVANTLIPLSLIAFLYACFSILLPTLYKIYMDNISSMSAIFLVIYGYPFIDLLLYAFTLFLGTKVENSVKNFFASIHFLLIGYAAGMILIVGYTEVEFYYLIGYFIFKNIFVNYIMRNWEKVVSNPPCLPGWGILYYVGYGLSFLPVIGVGKLVVAKSFFSYLFAKTSTVLYGLSNPLYPSASALTATSLTINTSFSGNIFWLAGVIIWIAFTFSQRYDRKKPGLYDFFYYLFGIHLFYLGIACSLSVYALTTTASLL